MENLELENIRKIIEKGLADFLIQNSPYSHLWDVMKYNVLAVGKRIRPVIMLEIAKMLGKSREEILPSACGIEYIHTASLMLDDLPCMDNAKLRRYQPTSHLVYGQASTILASIALILQGLSLIQTNAKKCQLSGEKTHNMMEFVYQRLGLGGMILGQSLDLTNMDNYTIIADHKTTSLFEVSVWVAGNLCHTTPEKLLDYIRHLGRAFQLADDLQDPVAYKIGKSSNSDTSKQTHCQLYGKEATRIEICKHIEKAKENLASVGYSPILNYLADSILPAEEK